jgi:hypothetical protein
MRCPSITYVPRVSGRCRDSDAIPQGEDDEPLDPKVPHLLDFRLQSNTCTLSEIYSPPSLSTESLDTCSDGSAEPPEVRHIIPDGDAFTNRGSQITFDVEDTNLTRNSEHPCWNIWQHASPWLKSCGYRLYEDDAPVDARPPPLNACSASQYPYGVFSTNSTLRAYNQVRERVLGIGLRRDDSISRAR